MADFEDRYKQAREETQQRQLRRQEAEHEEGSRIRQFRNWRFSLLVGRIHSVMKRLARPTPYRYAMQRVGHWDNGYEFVIFNPKHKYPNNVEGQNEGWGTWFTYTGIRAWLTNHARYKIVLRVQLTYRTPSLSGNFSPGLSTEELLGLSDEEVMRQLRKTLEDFLIGYERSKY